MSFQLKPSSMIAPQPEKVFKLTLSRLGEGGSTPPFGFYSEYLKNDLHQNAKTSSRFQHSQVNDFVKSCFFDAYCRAENGQSAGRCLKIRNGFSLLYQLSYRAQTYIFEKALDMITYVNICNNYFKIFFRHLNFFKILPYTLTIKVRGLILFE